jgi:5-methylcytosine-specific restriction endonuclease McrBC GTP-binding regulatory subunit McrB
MNPDEKVYLIIEEINRGNCAQIFGDLFQLLDRDKSTGVSEYPVKADKDLADYLVDVLGADHEGIKGGELKLPSNLIIYATMNTSDQSLFPMDSAFKRRWDWEYVPIEYGPNKDSYNYIITIGEKEYRWVKFLEIVNKKIYAATNSEDKQMGNFFIKKSIDAATFVNKVMFYLWNEVCKEEVGTSRNFFRREKDGKIEEFKFTDLFGTDRDTILNGFMANLEVKTKDEE